VLLPGGRLVLVDQFPPWRIVAQITGGRGTARTCRRAHQLLADAGFTSIAWQDLYATIIKAATATT